MVRRETESILFKYLEVDGRHVRGTEKFNTCHNGGEKERERILDEIMKKLNSLFHPSRFE